jgi:prepilin-type N-terminal cleavage/methylation domain-containing protein
MQKGFTLAELLVSISIITILSTIGVQSYITTQRSAKLKADVITVTSAIRQAQNRALSPSTGDLGMGVNDKLCAMGVRFNAQKKLQSYYVVEGVGGSCNDTEDYGEEIVYYGEEIVLSAASFGTASGAFEFRLPFATNTVGEKSLPLELSGVATKTITVTNAGLIKVN